MITMSMITMSMIIMIILTCILHIIDINLEFVRNQIEIIITDLDSKVQVDIIFLEFQVLQISVVTILSALVCRNVVTWLLVIIKLQCCADIQKETHGMDGRDSSNDFRMNCLIIKQI